MPLKISAKSNIGLNTFQPGVQIHKETSHLFCRTKQMIDFYMGQDIQEWTK